ncbi:hypothetical protein [Micromonospora matsumotoense]|uniref:hypothetical protein n=1 Tax=Micromonospora matsumotoense TaxID=121616 RepID=UPI003F4CB735
MDSGDWARRLLLCTQLASKTPAIEAHCLYFCAVTVRAALDVLHRRFGLASDDLRPRPALDVLVAAFHRGLETWTTRPHAATADQLATDTRAAFAAIRAADDAGPVRVRAPILGVELGCHRYCGCPARWIEGFRGVPQTQEVRCRRTPRSCSTCPPPSSRRIDPPGGVSAHSS